MGAGECGGYWLGFERFYSDLGIGGPRVDLGKLIWGFWRFWGFGDFGYLN